MDSQDAAVLGYTTSSLESRLLAAEAAREEAETRALRAEAENARLRQHLTTFGEQMLSAASPGGVVMATPSPAGNSTTSSSGSRQLSQLTPLTSSPGRGHDIGSSSRRLLETQRNDASSLSLSDQPAATPLLERREHPTSSSNDQPTSKRPRRWIFNPKWRVGRDWLEYDANKDTMGCSVCRIAGEGSKWARTGITRMRLEAITTHSNDVKHQRHLAEAARTAEQHGAGNNVPPVVVGHQVVRSAIGTSSTSSSLHTPTNNAVAAVAHHHLNHVMPPHQQQQQVLVGASQGVGGSGPGGGGVQPAVQSSVGGHPGGQHQK